MANQIKYQVGFDVDKSSLNQIKTSLQQLSRVKLSDIMKINGTDAQGAREILADIKEKAQQVEQALTKAFNTKLNTANIQEFKNQLKSLNIQDLYSSFSKAGAAGEVAFRQVSTQLLSTNIQLKESNTLLNKMGTTFLNTIKWNIASSAINAMSRSIQQAWGFTKELDTSLNDIRIVTGKSADEMANFAEKANKAAQNLGQTTTNYTKASLIYYQQGLQDGEVQARTDVTLKAANVTGQSAQQVSEQLTAVWNGYKVSAEQTEVYIDRLAAVAASSASNLEELSTGMSKVASAAAAMGVGEEQLAAQLSTIISVTRQAPQSVGTALRTVFARVADIKAGVDEEGVSLGNYSSKMAELGINVLDMNGNLRDMGEVMEQIGGKWANMSREQQVYLARTMAGQRQYNNLLALFDNFDMYNKQLEIAKNATGTLQKQQDTYMESTEAHLKQLRAALEGVYEKGIKTQGINKLIDGLKVATNFMSQFIQSLGGGGAALSSLGSIAFMVFSKQIGASLSTTINNMKIAREQTEFFKKAMAEAQQLQNKNVGNTYSKELLADQSKMMTLAAGGALTPESFNQIKESLLEFRQTADSLDLVKGKVEQIQGAFNNASPAIAQMIKDMGGLNEVLNDSNKMGIVGQQIEKIIGAISPLKEQLKDASLAFQEFLRNTNINSKNFNMDQALDSIKKVQTSLTSVINNLYQDQPDLGGIRLFDTLPQAAQSAVTKANQDLAGLTIDPTHFQQSKAVIEQTFKNFTTTLQNHMNDLQLALDSADPNSSKYQELQQQIQAISKALEEARIKKDGFLQSGMNTAIVQQFTAITSSITSLAMSVRNLHNLGSILKNEDLTNGEKLTQVIINLGMAIGMILPAFVKLNKALKLASLAKFQDATAANTAMMSNAAYAGSLGAVGVAASKATIKIRILNTVLSINPFVLVATAIAAVIALLNKLAQATEDTRKKLLELNNTKIEKENEFQEELDSHKQLYNSLETLNDQYKNQEITRYELKAGVQDLIQQYHLEGKAADELASSYANLDDYLKRNREQRALEYYDSAQRAFNSTKEVLINSFSSPSFTESMDEAFKTKYMENLQNNKYIFNVNEDAYNQSIDAIKNIADKHDIVYAEIEDFDQNTNEFIDLYENIEKAVTEIDELVSKGIITESQKNTDSLYNNYIDFLQQHEEIYTNYTNSLEELGETAKDVAAILSQSERDVDLKNIKTANEYYKQRELIAKAINEELKNNQDLKFLPNQNPTQLADAYLLQYNPDLYNQYDDAAKFIDRFNASGEEAQEIINKFFNLDAEHMYAVIDASDSISSLKELNILIDEIGNKDLSHIANLFGKNLNQLTNDAIENYKLYKDIYEKVQKGEAFSSSEYQSLPAKLKEMFDITPDGTYQMTKDFEDFATAVNNLQFDGFRKNLEAAFQTKDIIQDAYQFYQNSTPNVKAYGPSQIYNKVLTNENYGVQEEESLSNPGKTDITYDRQATQLRLDYLKIVNQTNDAELALIDSLEKKARLTEEDYQLIFDMLEKAGNVLSENQKQLDDFIQNNETLKSDASFVLDEDVDSKVFEKLSKLYEEENQKMAEAAEENSGQIEGLQEAMSKIPKQAKNAANAILRFDNALQDIIDHYDEWLEKLSTGNLEDFATIADDLADAYGDLLDIDASILPDDFLQDVNNLQLMQDVLNNVDGAYDELANKALQSILLDVDIRDDNFWDQLHDIQNYVQELRNSGASDIEIAAALQTSGVQDGLNGLLNMISATVPQANAIMRLLGFNATVKETEPKVETELVEDAYWVPPTYSTTVIPTGGEKEPHSYTALQLKTPGTWITKVGKKDTYVPGAGALQIDTFDGLSAGGGVKYEKSSNGGGSGGNSRRSSGSGGGGGKGGGGGGSSKGSEPDKSQKDRKKPVEDTRDIYHDINIQLKQIERQLNRVQDIQDRLYGKQLLDNLNEQTEILERQKKKLEEKRKIQLQDLDDQREKLEALKVEFDEYGNIKNYMSVLAAGQKEVNKLTDQYNALVDKYNASTDKDYKKTVADEIDALSKKLKEAEDNYKELEEKIKDYDSLREDMEDLVDDIDEIVQQEVELNITRFNMQLDIRLNMAQAERDWNEFKRNVIYKDNILKDTGFDTIFKDAMHSLDDVYTYFSTAGSKSIIQNLTEQLLNTRTEIEAIDSEGWSEIYGDDKARAMEDLKNNFNELLGQMQDMEELINEIDEAYLDTIDDVKDQFDKQIEDYEFIGELLQHDMDLLELLYGDKNYAAMDRYYAQLNQNNLQQLDSLRKQSQLWYEYWQAAVAEGNVADAAKFEENYREAISNLNSLIEESAENLKDKYINSIEQIFDELDRKISNGKGTDYLSMEWDLMNKNADEYLDTINSAFAVQELQSKYQKAINDTKNIRNQQTLKKLMDAQLENLRAKEKLTQYDVERAEKLLQIEQARMALQDAKASKTTMRLKRNAQGNYSYEYVADNSGVAEAQDALAAAQNDLYNFDKDRYNSNLEDILAAWKDFQSEYKEIIEDASLTEEDRVARLALLREEYGEYINDKTAENLVIRNNLMESAFMDIAALYNVDVENYQQMADDEKEILMGDLVPAWKSGIQEMTNTVVGSGGFLPTCEKAFDNITKATQKYERQLETMSRVAGTNLNMVKNGIDILADSTKTLIEDNDTLIDRLTKEIDTIKDLKLEVDSLKQQYKSVTDQANKAADAIHNFIKAQEEQAAKEAEKEAKKKAEQNKNNNTSGGGPGSGGTAQKTTVTSNNNNNNNTSNTSTNRSKYLDYTFKNNWPGRDFYLSGKYVGSFNGSGFTTKDAEIIQDMIDNGIWGKNYSAGAWPIYKSKTKTIDELLKSYGLKTGGYTGDWAGDSGRLALLHQKELVLNQEDTQNILDSVTILRQLLSSATGNIANRMFSLNNKNSIMQSLFGEGLEQNVHIDATFPNVNSKKEIEDAFNEIINLAAQKALK